MLLRDASFASRTVLRDATEQDDFFFRKGCPSIRAKALSRHKTPEQCFVHRVIARVVEDRSSETLTVNQLSAARLQVVPPTIDTVTNCGHDSSIRIPAFTGTRAPNQHCGLACADQRHPRAALDTNDFWIPGIRAQHPV